MRGTVAKRLRRLAAHHSQGLPHTAYEIARGQKTVHRLTSTGVPYTEISLTECRINSANSYRGRYRAIKQAYKRGALRSVLS